VPQKIVLYFSIFNSTVIFVIFLLHVVTLQFQPLKPFLTKTIIQSDKIRLQVSCIYLPFNLLLCKDK